MSTTTLMAAVAAAITQMTTAPAADTDAADDTGGLSPVNRAVADILARRETDKMIDAIVKGKDMLDGYDRDLRRFKPKPTGYNEDGSVAGTVWDKSDLDARNKLNAKREKLLTALNNAIDNADFGKLNDFVKGGGPKDDAPAADTAE